MEELERRHVRQVAGPERRDLLLAHRYLGAHYVERRRRADAGLRGREFELKPVRDHKRILQRRTGGGLQDEQVLLRDASDERLFRGARVRAGRVLVLLASPQVSEGAGAEPEVEVQSP